MTRTRRSLPYFCRFIILCFAALLTGAAAPPSDQLDVAMERVSVCGTAMASLNPDAYLPGELSTVFVNGCPAGQIWCASSCCRCCNPDFQVCCDASCTGVCSVTCSTCYSKR